MVPKIEEDNYVSHSTPTILLYNLFKYRKHWLLQHLVDMVANLNDVLYLYL